MRIIGPNCLGVMSPLTGLNATFARAMARPGNVGFISQSGALCTAVLDWSLREQVGFSAFVSIGSMLRRGLGRPDRLPGQRPAHPQHRASTWRPSATRAPFLSAAREVALTKPIIVIKPGRTEAAAKAAASHTGSLTGSDEVLEAAFRRSGVLRVNNISDLFYMAEVLAKQPRPEGPRLTIVTNAGGPGVLATDALITSGGELAELSTETMEALNKVLPAAWSHNNPIDILGDAGPGALRQGAGNRRQGSQQRRPAGHPHAAGHDRSDQDRRAAASPTPSIEGKPVLASWMGGADVAAGEEILNRAGIPTFPYPDTAARAFIYMWRYTYNLRGLYETPMPRQQRAGRGRSRPRPRCIVQAARQAGRTILTEFESKQLLAAYGIPTVETRIARNEDEAVRLAGEIGYPVVLKLFSETITHKTDVGGVQLNLQDADAVRAAYEAI